MIYGLITKIENDVYQIIANNGLIKEWFSRTELMRVEGLNIVATVPNDKSVSLRESAAGQSLSGGQGFKNAVISLLAISVLPTDVHAPETS